MCDRLELDDAGGSIFWQFCTTVCWNSYQGARRAQESRHDTYEKAKKAQASFSSDILEHNEFEAHSYESGLGGTTLNRMNEDPSKRRRKAKRESVQ